jgi:hypothetical protein
LSKWYLKEDGESWELTPVFRWFYRHSQDPITGASLKTKVLQQKLYREIPCGYGTVETKWRDIPIGDENESI